MENEEFYSKDKYITPYLLTQNDEVQYKGHKVIGETVYFSFSPKDVAEDLATKFQTNTANPVNPKRYADAIDFFRSVIFEVKQKMNNGAIYGNR